MMHLLFFELVSAFAQDGSHQCLSSGNTVGWNGIFSHASPVYWT